ncbi:MAG: hypothetical protein HFG54_03765 [Lachnospiraceae bacterium]|nr:hypothetical protein [Lachnospiraceae bacterium]
MIYRIQKSLDDFVCTGAECEDTCCKGWRIGIDRESMELYRSVKGPLGRRLFWGIDHRDHCFRLRGMACAFLNREGFCDIYKELGREGMCRECRTYPRHVEDYGNVQEVMLSLSCPEAARVILGDEKRGDWKEKRGQKNRKAGYEQEEFGRPGEEYILQDLEKLRNVMTCLIKNRGTELRQRLILVLALAHDFQRHWVKLQKEGCSYPENERRKWLDRLAGKALTWSGTERFSKKMKLIGEGDTEKMIRMAAWMRLTGEWEPVIPGWAKGLERMCSCLYHEQSVEEYGALCGRFSEEAGIFGQEWENLTLYFINTYVLGAVYDGDVYGKTKLAVFSVLVIREWCIFRYKITGKISREEIGRMAYQYSREMENSDRNLDALERELAENPLFRLDGMMKVLAAYPAD